MSDSNNDNNNTRERLEAAAARSLALARFSVEKALRDCHAARIAQADLDNWDAHADNNNIDVLEKLLQANRDNLPVPRNDVIVNNKDDEKGGKERSENAAPITENGGAPKDPLPKEAEVIEIDYSGPPSASPVASGSGSESILTPLTSKSSALTVDQEFAINDNMSDDDKGRYYDTDDSDRNDGSSPTSFDRWLSSSCRKLFQSKINANAKTKGEKDDDISLSQHDSCTTTLASTSKPPNPESDVVHHNGEEDASGSDIQRSPVARERLKPRLSALAAVLELEETIKLRRAFNDHMKAHEDSNDGNYNPKNARGRGRNGKPPAKKKKVEEADNTPPLMLDQNYLPIVASQPTPGSCIANGVGGHSVSNLDQHFWPVAATTQPATPSYSANAIGDSGHGRGITMLEPPRPPSVTTATFTSTAPTNDTFAFPYISSLLFPATASAPTSNSPATPSSSQDDRRQQPRRRASSVIATYNDKAIFRVMAGKLEGDM